MFSLKASSPCLSDLENSEEESQGCHGSLQQLLNVDDVPVWVRAVGADAARCGATRPLSPVSLHIKGTNGSRSRER
jgi:hypothetical protein